MESLKTNLDMYQLYKSVNKDTKELFELLKLKINVTLTDDDTTELQNFVKKLCSKYNTKWNNSHRVEAAFLTKNADWLTLDVLWPIVFSVPRENSHNESLDTHTSPCPVTTSASTSTSKGSRKQFENLSSKQKKRRTEHLIEYSQSELAFALMAKMKAEGENDIPKILAHLLEYPQDVNKTKEILFKRNEKSAEMPPVDALALMVSLGLSKWQYSILRKSGINQSSNRLPSYNKVLSAKKECYPPNEDIVINDVLAKIKLQSILNLTAKRILQICDIPEREQADLVLLCKWGFDGASGQSMYNQVFESGDSDTTDSSVFMTSLVPIKLSKDGRNVWENPRPSSTHYCRPIKFEFVKETTNLTKEEKAKMTEEIDNLVPTVHKNITITHKLVMTMIDGKINSALTDTATSNCSICQAKPKQMNDVAKMTDRPLNTDFYKYGLSTLHLWIRCFECLLKISYNKDFESTRAMKTDKKNMKEIRRQKIIKDFRSRMGILVDVVKQGVGTTNCGNTARTFFKNYALSAEITGIDEQLILRIAVLLQTVSSGKPIKVENFANYAKDTAQLYVSLYGWYNMTPSLHKLLIHGADIVQHFSHTPIGKLSEEASEARNKDFRNVREHHSRKIGRKETNEDILHSLLVSSDPVISHKRPRYSRPVHQEMFPEALELLDLQNEEEEMCIDISAESEMLDFEQSQDPLSME